MRNQGDSIKNALSHFGRVDRIFLGGHGEKWKNAFFKIVTTKGLAELVRAELKNNFTLENGYLVDVTLEEGPMLTETRGIYYIYIVPNQELDDRTKEEQTRRCVNSIAHLMYNLSKKRGRLRSYRTSRKI